MLEGLSRCLFVALVWSMALAGHGFSQDAWPRFRGPNGDGVGRAPGVAAEWTDANRLWIAELGGAGHGSPVVWGSRLFVTTGEPESGAAWLIACDAATGKELWRREQPGGERAMHASNSYASTTPAVDADRVYLSGDSAAGAYVAAYTHDGQEQWRRSLGPYNSSHGFGSSPTVEAGVVCIADDQLDESAVLGLDAATGDIRWRAPRPSGKAAYATPCLIGEPSDRAVVVQSQAAGMVALDLKTGDPRWSLPDVFPARCVSSPTTAGGLILGVCGGGGSGKHLVAIDASAAAGADATQAEEVYRLTRGVPYVPTPLVVGELIFLWHDGGTVVCVDRATGKTHWRERIGGKFFGSPVCTGDAVVAISTAGEVTAIAVDTEACRVLGRNDLGEPSHATPAIAGGKLFVRTESRLHCIAGAPRTGSEQSAAGSKQADAQPLN